MNQNNIEDLPKLRNDNYANIFNVYTDENERYFYNILQTVNIPSNLPENYYFEYNVVYGDSWSYISYKNYNTPNLWWVITKTNNIINPVEQPEPGTVLKILKQQLVTLILNEITTQIS
jgi:hypothetical protein